MPRNIPDPNGKTFKEFITDFYRAEDNNEDIDIPLPTQHEDDPKKWIEQLYQDNNFSMLLPASPLSNSDEDIEHWTKNFWDMYNNASESGSGLNI